MPTFERTLEEIAKLLRREASTERAREKNLRDADKSKAYRDENDALLAKELERIRAEKQGQLDELVRYPPFHDRHFSLLNNFHAPAKGSFEQCVFIMTKFPEGNTAEDLQLQKIISAVEDSITDCGYVPRIASENPPYHPLLWDNVELYLLGSSRGIAILESKYKPELNPNVAMEWGWMRGMGRKILPPCGEGLRLPTSRLGWAPRIGFRMGRPRGHDQDGGPELAEDGVRDLHERPRVRADTGHQAALLGLVERVEKRGPCRGFREIELAIGLVHGTPREVDRDTGCPRDAGAAMPLGDDEPFW